MNITKTVHDDMIVAMKKGTMGKQEKDELSYLLNALQVAAKNKRTALTEVEEGQVVTKMIKQTKETLSMTPENRTDIVEKCNFSLSVLDKYAPKMISENEIRHYIHCALETLELENPQKSDKGKIMKVLMPMVKGKADGAQVNLLLQEYLK